MHNCATKAHTCWDEQLILLSPLSCFFTCCVWAVQATCKSLARWLFLDVFHTRMAYAASHRSISKSLPSAHLLQRSLPTCMYSMHIKVLRNMWVNTCFTQCIWCARSLGLQLHVCSPKVVFLPLLKERTCIACVSTLQLIFCCGASGRRQKREFKSGQQHTRQFLQASVKHQHGNTRSDLHMWHQCQR